MGATRFETFGTVTSASGEHGVLSEMLTLVSGRKGAAPPTAPAYEHWPLMQAPEAQLAPEAQVDPVVERRHVPETHWPEAHSPPEAQVDPVERRHVPETH